MTPAQLTPRAQAVIADSDEYTAPIFHRSEIAGSSGCSEERPCMPCYLNRGACMGKPNAAIAATAATGEAS